MSYENERIGEIFFATMVIFIEQKTKRGSFKRK